MSAVIILIALATIAIIIIVCLCCNKNSIKFKPYPVSSERYIPLNMFTTWHDKNFPPRMKSSVEKMKADNPEFTLTIFDEEDCRQFIIDNFSPEVIEAYDNIIPKAYKSDLWRLCVLYILGGVYFDIKYHTVNGFKLINLTYKNYFVRDLPGSGAGVCNGFMISNKNNPILLNAINNIVDNVKNKYYGSSSLSPTGPRLLKTHFSKEDLEDIGEITFAAGSKCNPDRDDCSCMFYKGYLHEDDPTRPFNGKIITMYPEYRSEQNTHGERYYDLWKRGKIYK